MKRERIPAAVALVVAVAFLACQKGEADPATQAMLSDVTIGSQVGPIPGADRPVKHVANPYGGDPNARAEGFRLFNWYNCSGCHGSHAGGGMGPSLRDSTWLYGNHPDDIFNSIAEGRAHGMPSWGAKVPTEQIWKLVTYIESLGTQNEASPPPPLPAQPPPVPQAQP